MRGGRTQSFECVLGEKLYSSQLLITWYSATMPPSDSAKLLICKDTSLSSTSNTWLEMRGGGWGGMGKWQHAYLLKVTPPHWNGILYHSIHMCRLVYWNTTCKFYPSIFGAELLIRVWIPPISCLTCSQHCVLYSVPFIRIKEWGNKAAGIVSVLSVPIGQSPLSLSFLVEGSHLFHLR